VAEIKAAIKSDIHGFISALDEYMCLTQILGMTEVLTIFISEKAGRKNKKYL